jgi:hypothetical protein
MGTYALEQKGASLTGKVGLGNPLISFRVPIESGHAGGRSLSLTARGVFSFIGYPASAIVKLDREYRE